MDLSLANIRAKNPNACSQATSYYATVIQRRHGGQVTPSLLKSLDRNGYIQYGVNMMTTETRRTIIAYLNDVDPEGKLGLGSYREMNIWAVYYALQGCHIWPENVLQMIADICNDQED